MGTLRFPRQGGFESVAGLLSCRKLLKDVTPRPRKTAEGRDGHLPILTIGGHCCSTERLHGRSPRTGARQDPHKGREGVYSEGFLNKSTSSAQFFCASPQPEIAPGLGTEHLICCGPNCFRQRPGKAATTLHVCTGCSPDIT